MASPLFCLLFASYPVLFIAVTNPGQASWDTVATAAAAAALVSTLLLIGLRPAFRSWGHAGLAVGVATFLFYAYGPMHAALEMRLLASVDRTAGAARYQQVAPYLHPALTAIWAVAGLLLLRAVRKVPTHWIGPAVGGCNAMAYVLVAAIGFQWAGQRGAHAAAAGRHEAFASSSIRTSTLGYAPDIYVIVLDGYAREDVLRRQYGFDNRKFLDGLEALGFETSDLSNANYSWTFLSLASSLNMNYLQPMLGEQLSSDEGSHAPVYEAVQRNALAVFLKERGYRVVHFQSTAGVTFKNRYADEEVACGRSLFASDFHRAVVDASWFKIFQSQLSSDLAECVQSHLDRLGDMGSEPGPKFVFAHFLPPHHPYLFDREGRVLRNATLSDQFEYQKRLWEARPAYVEQLAYMNRRIRDAVVRIQRASVRPPIIVIYSDHGPSLEHNLTREEQIRVRFANLAVFLLPQASRRIVGDDVSSVNQFRLILNHYFDARLEILPDRYFFSPYDRPYAFTEVTLSKEVAE